MKTLICGAGPIGQWLALRLTQAGSDVALLARGRTYDQLDRSGVVIVDGLTGERMTANVLHEAGYRRRRPAIFNLYDWLPRWLESVVFGKLFGSSASEIRFGLHARTVGTELLELAEDFRGLTMHQALTTPTLNEMLDGVLWYESVVSTEEVA